MAIMRNVQGKSSTTFHGNSAASSSSVSSSAVNSTTQALPSQFVGTSALVPSQSGTQEKKYLDSSSKFTTDKSIFSSCLSGYEESDSLDLIQSIEVDNITGNNATIKIPSKIENIQPTIVLPMRQPPQNVVSNITANNPDELLLDVAGNSSTFVVKDIRPDANIYHPKTALNSIRTNAVAQSVPFITAKTPPAKMVPLNLTTFAPHSILDGFNSVHGIDVQNESHVRKSKQNLPYAEPLKFVKNTSNHIHSGENLQTIKQVERNNNVMIQNSINFSQETNNGYILNNGNPAQMIVGTIAADGTILLDNSIVCSGNQQSAVVLGDVTIDDKGNLTFVNSTLTPPIDKNPINSSFMLSPMAFPREQSSISILPVTSQVSQSQILNKYPENNVVNSANKNSTGLAATPKTRPKSNVTTPKVQKSVKSRKPPNTSGRRNAGPPTNSGMFPSNFDDLKLI